MLFYVQMRWNYQGRLSQDQLWTLEAEEGAHALAGVKAGMVKSIYKVAAQHRVIAIVEVESAEDMDRNTMGALPMREYLEFEQVWALRDYEGFVEDVRRKYRPTTEGQTPTTASPASGKASTERETREMAQKWFGALARGDLDGAMACLARDAVWENIPPTPGISDVAPWLGSHRGRDAVLESFKLRSRYSRMESATLLDLMVQGDQAVGLVHEKARCLATGNAYELHVSTHLTIRNRQITESRAFWDPSPLVAAYGRQALVQGGGPSSFAPEEPPTRTGSSRNVTASSP